MCSFYCMCIFCISSVNLAQHISNVQKALNIYKICTEYLHILHTKSSTCAKKLGFKTRITRIKCSQCFLHQESPKVSPLSIILKNFQHLLQLPQPFICPIYAQYIMNPPQKFLVSIFRSRVGTLGCKNIHKSHF